MSLFIDQAITYHWFAFSLFDKVINSIQFILIMESVLLLLKKYVLENGRRGDIQHVIGTIDRFGWKEQ